MNITAKAAKIIEILKQSYPEPLCALEYAKDYELLFAARLAAQCTDERVNKITPVLFGRFKNLTAISEADVLEIEEIIHSVGFFRAKARDIKAAATMLLHDYDGCVPDTMEELLKLPGVGRKTANLLLGDIYKKPAVVVDTHCIRLSNRLGLVATKDPVKIETELRKILPPDESNDFCHRLVLHGRAVCSARSPKCSLCSLSDYCANCSRQFHP